MVPTVWVHVSKSEAPSSGTSSPRRSPRLSGVHAEPPFGSSFTSTRLPESGSTFTVRTLAPAFAMSTRHGSPRATRTVPPDSAQPTARRSSSATGRGLMKRSRSRSRSSFDTGLRPPPEERSCAPRPAQHVQRHAGERRQDEEDGGGLGWGMA